MTLDELISELEDLRDEHGGGIEVRLAHQPSWPFEYSVDKVVASPDDEGDEKECPECGEPLDYRTVDGQRVMVCMDRQHCGFEAGAEDAPPPVVYIAEGRQIGYLPGEAAKALGWGRK
jgi:predicted RNA-binding Zn-ribbon protein involved in translation (DUF1610 family)